ncbi:MAG: DNA polymerase domain-containing protein [Candidatus Diapherotrites archaeon]
MPRAVNGILLDVDYAAEGDDARLGIYVKTKSGIERFVEKNFRPYFYIIAESAVAEKKLLKELPEKEFPGNIKITVVEAVKRKNAEHVLRLSFRNTGELSSAREHVLKLPGVRERREFDIPFVRRYLIDSGLEPMGEVELGAGDDGSIASAKNASGGTASAKNAAAGGSAGGALKMCAFDIETYTRGEFPTPDKDAVISISYVCENGGTVFSYGEGWEKGKANAAHWEGHGKKGVEVLKDEKEMLKAFVDAVKLSAPDVLVTYNGDMFDFPYLKDRAKKLGVKFDIGFGGTEPIFIKKGMDSAARLKGIQHLDAYQVVRILTRIGALDLMKLDLESVVEGVFKKKKEKLHPDDMAKLWRERKGLERLSEYNYEDAYYTLKIAQEHLPLFAELSRLVRQTLFDTSRAMSSTLVEALLIARAFETKRLIPNKPEEEDVKSRMLQTFKGGYVKEPIAGLHENIAVLDFRSLHPSIMISHNVSQETLKCAHAECKNGKNLSPDKDWFCTKEKGLIPEMLEDVLDKRVAAKKEMKKAKEGSLERATLEARQHALKIVLNATYGSLGYARFRWYSREAAKAVTAWSRHYIRETMHSAEEAGFKVLYGDSITSDRFVVVQNPLGHIEVRDIEGLFAESAHKGVRAGGKEQGTLKGYRALSLNLHSGEPEWKPITCIIRHKTGKKVFRAWQKYGETRVTEDHSLIVQRGGEIKEAKPQELKGEQMISVGIPRGTESTLKEIDLFEIMKGYSYGSKYRGIAKTSSMRSGGGFVWFGWMNKKNQVKVKRKIAVESAEFEALCRLLGAYVSEGSSCTRETCEKKKGASIASSDVKWLEALKRDYHTLFINAKTCVIPSMVKERVLNYKVRGKEKTVTYRDNSHKLQMMNETSAVFFKMLCGQKSYGKTLPQFIFNAPDKYKRIMVKKILEGDGSRSVNERLGYSKAYKERFFKLETKSLGLASGLSLLLEQLGQNHTIRYRQEKQTYCITSSSKHNKKIMTRVWREPYSGFVYDLAVGGNNNFVDACGRILLHNTDSSLLLVPKGKTKDDVLAFMEKINKKLPGVMELEFQGMYRRGIFVTKREGTAAKKRYALIDFNDNIKIVGFEYVRRDWARVAKETQRDVLSIILKEGDTQKALALLRRRVAELKAGKTPKRELTIMTQITKPLGKYASIGPHIAAAKKAIARGKQLGMGSLVSYIITKKGKSISDRAELEEFVKEGDYDADYYIENQVVPAVQKIFAELGYAREDLISGGKQASLSSFS